MSIVIPAFNEAVFLAACLESVLAQSSNDWEAIVVDDASPDVDLESVTRELRDDRIRIVRHETNLGLGAARNTGFRSARAHLMLPLDSDDLLHKDFLSTVTRPFLDVPETDCAFTDFRLFGSSEEIWHNRSDLTLRDMLVGQWIPGPGTLMRRGVWERTNGYCEDRGFAGGNEDWDFWITALAGGLNIVHIPEALYLYRRHGNSMSSFSLRYDEYLQRELMYRRHKALFDSYGLGGSFRAKGYLNSAVFSWALGERFRGVSLAGAALRRRQLAWAFVNVTARTALRAAGSRRRRWFAKISS